MNNFPIIRHLDDVIDEFETKAEFSILDRGDYIVIDYNYVDSDTFSSPILTEGRGLKFDRTGKIIGRPFHKFFNLGEKPETMLDALDWSLPVVAETKHDGSMIHPVLIDDEIVLMTRKGDTDVARQCEAECDVPWGQMRYFLEAGITPIYEFVSPNNQIVVKYDRPELRLLARRHIIRGKYLGGSVSTRQVLQPNSNMTAFVTQIRMLEGEEGVVLVWPNGNRVKIKADDYVRLHRTIDTASSEARLLEVIFENNLDDLLPLLPEARVERVTKFNNAMAEATRGHIADVQTFLDNTKDFSQKDFALKVMDEKPKAIHAMYFKGRDDGAQSAVMQVYRNMLRKQKGVEQHRELLLGGVKL